MARQCWRHLVLFGLLGFLRCFRTTQMRSLFQPKPETVTSSKHELVSAASQVANVLQFVPTCACSCTCNNMFIEKIPVIPVFTKSSSLPCYEKNVERHGSKVTFRICCCTKSISQTFPNPHYRNISDTIVLHTPLCQSCVKNLSWDISIFGGATSLRGHKEN